MVTGFQIFLCVLFGIIAFFVLVLSVPVKISLAFDNKIHLTVKYLFLKINILPTGPKKEKAPKPKKEPKPKPEKPKDETPKEKKPNPILEMVKANGYDGMMLVIKNLGSVLATYGGKIFKSIVFDEIDVYICVGTGDAAATAIKYGETCQKVYPVFGFICSNNLVKKYDILVEPDFLANKTENELYIDMSLTIRKIINATIAMVFRLIFKVGLKFITGAKKGKENNQTQNNKTAPTADKHLIG